MQKPQGIIIGTYGVREIGIYKEKILHAPKTTEGRFKLVAYPNGDLMYMKVHP